MNQLPTIDIIFKQQAYSFVERSERGNVILILRDSTDITFNTKEYRLITEVEEDVAKYTAENLQYIKDAMVGTPNLVTVVRIDLLGTIADALTLVATLPTGWTSIVGEQVDYEAISTWTKQLRVLKKYYKSIVTDTTEPADNEGVVDLFKTTVTFKDGRGEQSSEEIIPTILGLLAGANVQRGTTYMTVPNLASVVEPVDVNAEITLGKFVLINDYGIVKIALGINSLTTFDAPKTEDFSSIEIVEAMDMISEDLNKTFKNDFISKYKNNYDNQIVFISAVNTYFKALANEGILDINFENISGVNIEKQRQAWISVGKVVAVDWSDAEVKNMTFKKQLFLFANVKILQSMTDLDFIINMV